MIDIKCLYQTKIECSNYNPNLGDTITVTVTVLDFNNSPVTGENVTVKVNTGVFSNGNQNSFTQKTNQYGQVSVNYTCSSSGLVQFTCNMSCSSVYVREYLTKIMSIDYHKDVWSEEYTRLVFTKLDNLVMIEGGIRSKDGVKPADKDMDDKYNFMDICKVPKEFQQSKDASDKYWDITGPDSIPLRLRLSNGLLSLKVQKGKQVQAYGTWFYNIDTVSYLGS